MRIVTRRPAILASAAFALVTATSALQTPVQPKPDTPLSDERKLDIEVRRRVRAAPRALHEYAPEWAPYWLAPRARDVLLDVHDHTIGDPSSSLRALVALVDVGGGAEKRGVFVLAIERPTATHTDRRATIELRSCADAALLATARSKCCPDAGVAFATGRDVTGDGVADFAIGHSCIAGSCKRPGVDVFSGADPAAVLALRAPFEDRENHDFGASVALVGDLDGDELADVIVGFEDDPDRSREHYVCIFNGRTGRLLATCSTPFGAARVAALDRDVDGDGRDEFLVHCRGGPVWVVSGRRAIEQGRAGAWEPLRLVAEQSW